MQSSPTLHCLMNILSAENYAKETYKATSKMNCENYFKCDRPQVKSASISQTIISFHTKQNKQTNKQKEQNKRKRAKQNIQNETKQNKTKQSKKKID